MVNHANRHGSGGSDRKETLQNEVSNELSIERKAQIMQIAIDHQIDSDEPFWLVFKATGHLESLVLELPSQLKQIAKSIGLMGGKYEASQAVQQKIQVSQRDTLTSLTQLQAQQSATAQEQAEVTSALSELNAAQSRRTIFASVSWVVVGAVLLQLSYAYLPFSQLKIAEDDKLSIQIVDAFGSKASALHWLYHHNACEKEAAETKTGKCTINLWE